MISLNSGNVLDMRKIYWVPRANPSGRKKRRKHARKIIPRQLVHRTTVRQTVRDRGAVPTGWRRFRIANPGRYEVYAGTGGGDRVFTTDSSAAATSFARSLSRRGTQTYVFDTETRRASRPNPGGKLSARDKKAMKALLKAHGFKRLKSGRYRTHLPAMDVTIKARGNPSSSVPKHSKKMVKPRKKQSKAVADRRNALRRLRAALLHFEDTPRGIVRRNASAKYRAAPAWLKAKRERCIKKVKARGGKYNAWAICTKSVSRGKHYNFRRPN